MLTDCPPDLLQNDILKDFISCLDQTQANSRPAGMNPLSTPVLMMC